MGNSPKRRRKAIDYNAPEFSSLLKAVIANKLDDKKALKLVSINLANKTDIADYMLIASGTSGTHISALASHVMKLLEKMGIEYSVDGLALCEWVLIDTPYVVVHLFRSEVREHYNLEKMWQPTFENVIRLESAN